MTKKETFEQIYQRACKRKGGEAELQKLLKKPKSNKELTKLGDDRYLAEFTKKIFQSGFVWKVVEKKWPDFEKAFFEFDVQQILMQPEEFFEKVSKDPRIVRNYRKVKTIRENAFMIHDVRCEDKPGSEGGRESFAKFIADWPSENIVGLWDFLKKRGSRLGGNTGPYALRTLGKDTFLLSRDVEKFLRAEDVFSGGSASKRSQQQIQEYFNEIKAQSGLPYQQISQIISYSFGDNFVFPE